MKGAGQIFRARRRRYGEVLLAMVDMGQNKINPCWLFRREYQNRVKNALVCKGGDHIDRSRCCLIIALAVASYGGQTG